MSGGLLTLVANLGEPGKYYHNVYHKNFAYETQKYLEKSDIEFGNEYNYNYISKFGDILHSITLWVKLPEIRITGGKFRWKNNIGEILMDFCGISICNYNPPYDISQHGEFYNVWDNLTLTKEQIKSKNQLIGQQNPIEFVDNDGIIIKKMNGLQTFKNYHPETSLTIPIRFKLKNTNKEYGDYLNGIPVCCLVINHH